MMRRTSTPHRAAPIGARILRRPGAKAVHARGLMLLLALGVGLSGAAQGTDPWALPEPTPALTEDFADGSAGGLPPGWSVRYWAGGSSSWTLSTTEPSCASGRWGQHAAETGALSGVGSVLVLDQSLAEDPLVWTNFRMEFDFTADTRSRVGVLIGGSGGGTAGSLIQEGYLFLVENIPTESQANSEGRRSTYRLFRRIGGVDTEISRAPVVLDPTVPGLGTVYETCYRLRVEFFCGNLRIRVRRLDGLACDGGWCTIVEWTDPNVTRLTPGFVGLYHGGMDPATAARARFDNLEVGTWGTECAQVCEEWPPSWSEISRQSLTFKYLYEGALLDYSYAANVAANKIDLATEAPAVDLSRTNPGTGYCNGWQLLVDLPPRIGGSDTTDAILSYLEPMHTAVQYGDQGSGLEWFDSFDQDPESATYDPVPIVTDGSTPIANAMYDAYQWFVDKRTSEDSTWSDDPLARCRSWYVFLITDGEENCARNSFLDPPVLDQVCESGEAAELFAAVENPAESSPGIPVFTVGFSDSVSTDSPLQCIVDANPAKNVFKTAANATALQEELSELINLLDSRSRSFVPFKISPPPSSSGAASRELDYLTVFPFFTPRNDSTIWDGDLFAFRLNEANPTIPATSDTCEVDFSQVVWEASAVLQDQFNAGYSRPTFFADSASGSWTRHNLLEVTDPAEVALRNAFSTRLSIAGTVTPEIVQEIVNFVRNERRTDLTSSVGPARPIGTSVLGDVYHSQPVFVGPPNNPAFFYDYGFSATGASSYRLFANKHAQRRRVVLAGANDGLLHAFDAGYYDRDLQGQSLVPPESIYTNQHDLGSGKELFTVLPMGVANRLWALTYGTSADDHDYLVDGRISVSDFLSDHDGSSLTPKVWRTAAITTLRRGGRSLVALDLTQPDPVTGFVPSDLTSIGAVPTWESDGSTDLPGCLDGSTTNCDGEYPRVLWEFTDPADLDGNGYTDLGWTWSKPAIARLAIHNASQPDQPDSRFVAFFGGGHDETRADELPVGAPDGVIEDHTGLYVYAVDLATGSLIHKEYIGRMVPGSFRALDSDLDGFHDRVYFASEGSIWRISLPGPLDSSADGTVAGADFERIFDFREDPSQPTRGYLDEQLFFMEPITVPALFDGVTYTWGLALGSGDRADLGAQTDPADPHIDHFFFVLDNGQTEADDLGIDDLLAMSYTNLPNLNSDSATPAPAACSTNALNPAGGLYGWYLALRPDEKVTFEATVVDGYINFPTFEPGLGLLATDPPNVCGSGASGGGGAGVDPGELDPDTQVCSAAGIGRVYKLWYECGIAGESGYQEVNDIITGQEAYTIGGNTYVSFTGSTPGSGPTLEYPGSQGYTITNWRQN